MFQQVGAGAYKAGLENTWALDEHFGYPHRSYRTIHIAGTNGKGSCSHTLAAILQHAGYRVGLYTSPHLIDFRERIRVNGQPVPEEYVVRFVEEERGFFEPLHPSFFELTTAMAFRYFAEEKVDVAVIEVGLGGRLDCTNVIRPDLRLKGTYQVKNRRALLAALPLLRGAGYRIREEDVRAGFARVVELTGLMGRWQQLQEHPALVCDTGHNVGGIAYIAGQLRQQACRQLHIVIGMVNDKDIRGVLALLPREAIYYFTQASVKRALPAAELARLAAEAGLKGDCFPDVPSAVRAAQKKSLPEDFIFVGGSTFIVADLLANRDALNLH